MTQKQKQSVIVNLNLDKAKKKRKRRKAKRGGGGLRPSQGGAPMFPYYGFPPQQQSVQPTLNNITDYLKMKEGQDNGRHVNIMEAMRRIRKGEGAQGTAPQTEEGAGSSTQAPAAEGASKPPPAGAEEESKGAEEESKGAEGGASKGGRKKGSTKTTEEKAQAKRERDLLAALRAEEEQKKAFNALNQPTAGSDLKPGYKAGPTSDFSTGTPPNGLN